jgi:hypothetical protein
VKTSNLPLCYIGYELDGRVSISAAETFVSSPSLLDELFCQLADMAVADDEVLRV